ncbi:Aldo/keto reductase family protein [Streptomyces sp. DvalAA-14]|nr:Aldo/keto reductase family protein [Streptomyces sp. DvalAA-14]
MSHRDTPESRDTSADGRRPGGPAALAGRTVSRIGYGAMQLARHADDPGQAIGLLRRAVELGIDHFDTAQFYGNGLVNDLIRQALRTEDVLVSSKIAADADPGGPVHLRLAQRPAELRASVEDNLKSLGVEQVAVVNLRRPDDRPGLRGEGDQAVGLDDQLAVLTAMRAEGKIGAIGLSNITLDGLRRAISASIVCVQNAYSPRTYPVPGRPGLAAAPRPQRAPHPRHRGRRAPRVQCRGRPHPPRRRCAGRP